MKSTNQHLKLRNHEKKQLPFNQHYTQSHRL